VTRVTIAGLANQLGLSKASVSYALNGQPGVSDDTRAKVVNLATELGWYPSSSARALSHARADVIGIVLSREPESIGSEPYYMSLLAGIESVLAEAEMGLLLRMVGPDAGRDLAVYERWSGERRVDGVILFDQLDNDPRPELLGRLRMPFVLHGASEPIGAGATTYVDQSVDAAAIIDHLQLLGHSRLGHVTGPLTLIHERARCDAVRRLAHDAGMDVAAVESDYTLEGAMLATRQLMARTMPPTALIYDSDLMAVGGTHALRELRIAVPASAAVVSWDESILCRLVSPPLTALQRDPVEQGRRSARLLLDVIAGRSLGNASTLASRLLVRASTIGETA
jgi:DNA-binding LacI/PurR family transcriptional regulator